MNELQLNNKLYIGTSGWSYGNWKGLFYPEKLASAKFLAYYSTQYNCTEINSSFYRIPLAKTAEKWAATVPDDFLFCTKLYRGITHFSKLKNPEAGLQVYFERMAPLQPKLAMVLVQLPPSLAFNPEVVAAFYEALKIYQPDYKFALEARHKSWFSDESLLMMSEAGITHVISDAGKFYVGHKAVTTDTVYIRMHGRNVLFSSSYTNEELDELASEIIEYLQEDLTVFVFFNNTMHGNAVQNANYLKNRIQEIFRN
jgi:uncharacterized protein YecE (DUF72 family)